MIPVISRYREQVIEWASGRSWLPRLPLILFFAYLLFRHLGDPSYKSVFGGLNLGIHEFGHLIFGPFGEWIGIAGGTVFQLFVPLASVVMFYRQRDYFAISFSLGWLGTNLFDVAAYIADARAMQIPLVSPFGGAVYHDWNYLLSHAGWLQHDLFLAILVRACAVCSMTLGLAYGAWVLWEMAHGKSAIES